MTVGELKKMLEQYPDDIEVIHTRLEVITVRHGVFRIVEEEDWSLITGVRRAWGLMLSHPKMSPENKALEKKYLHLMAT